MKKVYQKPKKIPYMTQSQVTRALIQKEATNINIIDEIDIKPTCKEDFRDWLIDNWEVIEDTIEKSIEKVAKEYSGDNFNIEDSVDNDVLVHQISDDIKQGLLNVIDTYE